MNYIVVLFKDGSCMFYPEPNIPYMKKDNFENGSRFFKTHESTTVENLSVWIANRYSHEKYFTEVDPWA